jgi:hypothetical protein
MSGIGHGRKKLVIYASIPAAKPGYGLCNLSAIETI